MKGRGRGRRRSQRCAQFPACLWPPSSPLLLLPSWWSLKHAWHPPNHSELLASRCVLGHLLLLRREPRLWCLRRRWLPRQPLLRPPPLGETMDEVGISYVTSNSSYECHGESFDAPLQPPWVGAVSTDGCFADFGASRGLGTLSNPRSVSPSPLFTRKGEAFAHLLSDSSLAHGRMCPYRGPLSPTTLWTLEPPRVEWKPTCMTHMRLNVGDLLRGETDWHATPRLASGSCRAHGVSGGVGPCNPLGIVLETYLPGLDCDSFAPPSRVNLLDAG